MQIIDLHKTRHVNSMFCCVPFLSFVLVFSHLNLPGLFLVLLFKVNNLLLKAPLCSRFFVIRLRVRPNVTRLLLSATGFHKLSNCCGFFDSPSTSGTYCIPRAFFPWSKRYSPTPLDLLTRSAQNTLVKAHWSLMVLYFRKASLFGSEQIWVNFCVYMTVTS